MQCGLNLDEMKMIVIDDQLSRDKIRKLATWLRLRLQSLMIKIID